MTIKFHRLTVPSYAGGLPTDYDYVNNALVGTPSPANGVLSGGPNSGSYFIGFGEDATTANSNRPNRALAQNTDYLDDILHRDIAIPIVSSTRTGGSLETSLSLPVGTFLGTAGTANNTVGLLPYFHITDDEDNDIVNGSGDRIVVTSLTLTSPDAIGGGFSQNTVTAVFSEAIPGGRSYRVYYSTRSNLATLPQDALTNIRIRGAQEVSYELEDLIQDLKGNNLAWDAPWTATVFDLAAMGLNEKYSRKVTKDGTVPDGWPVTIANGTAGSGAWFDRSGPGITGYSYVDVSAATSYAVGVGWMAGALFSSINRDIGPSPIGLTGSSRLGGETTGFYHLGARRGTTIPSESGDLIAPGFASFFHGNAIETESGSEDATWYSWIPAGTVVTCANGHTISSFSPAYFAQNGGTYGTLCAIAFGYDLIELDFGDGKKRQFVMSALVSNDTIQVADLDGSNPGLPNGNATVVRWIRLQFGVSENAARLRAATSVGSNGGVLFSGGVFADPPVMVSYAPSRVPSSPALSVYSGEIKDGLAAFQWGAYTQQFSTYIPKGFLNSDGSVYSTSNTTSRVVYLGATNAASFNIRTDGDTLKVTNPSGTGTFTVTVGGVPPTGNSYSSGKFTIVMARNAGTLTTMAIVANDPTGTPVTVKWEPGTADTTLSGVTTSSTDIYTGLYIDGVVYMSVQRFPG